MADVSAQTPTSTQATPAQVAADASKSAETTKNQPGTGTLAPQKQTKSQTPVDAAINEVSKNIASASNDVDDVEDDGSDLEQDAPKEQQKASKYKIKVSGKEVEVDETELVKRAQMGFSAEEKWQEAAKMRKQVEGFVGLLQQDPIQALEKLGLNVDELAEKHIQRRIEEMQKSPEQLERERFEAERKQWLEEKTRIEQETREREIKQLQDQYAVELETEITEAFAKSDSGIPKSPAIVKRVADILIYAHKNKMQVSAKQALEVAQAEFQQEMQELYALAPDEVFERIVGKDRLNKYRRSKLKKSPSKPAPTVADIKPTGTKELKAQENTKQAEKMSYKEFFKKLGK